MVSVDKSLMISNALNLILMIVLIIFNMINIGIWPMVILALLIIANSIFMVYKTVDVKNANEKAISLLIYVRLLLFIITI